MSVRLLVFLLWLLPFYKALPCIWCAGNPKMKPTVIAGEPDPGGLFSGNKPDPAKVRRYFIAAEAENWDYLPAGEDPVMKMTIPTHLLEGSKTIKLRYREYTDATFTTRALPCERLGIMGPVMRGVTGDFIVVTLLNRLSQPISLHPHGVRYDKDSEGASYFPDRGLGAAIGPGAQFTYVWHLDEASGPQPDEPSSKPWLYHSHVSSDAEINAGLSGFIIVTDPARARPDGTPADVDREMALLYQNYNESPMDEAAEYAEVASDPGIGVDPPTPSPWWKRQEAIELGMRHAINGRIFGNATGMEMREGENVRWYVFALGNEADVHTAHWHGARLKDRSGHMMDVMNLMPGNMTSADLLAERTGNWMFHCHVGEHMMEGMYGAYRVLPKDSPAPAASPFFGNTDRLESASILVTDGELSEKNFHLNLDCTLTAYEDLSVWASAVGISAGEKSTLIPLNRAGTAETSGVKYQVLNADESGIVRSDLLKLKISLSGDVWKKTVSEALSHHQGILPVKILLDGATHHTKLHLVSADNHLRLQP